MLDWSLVLRKKSKVSTEEKPKKKAAKKSSLVAKKDFRIVHNEYDIKIVEGDTLDDVPEMFLENLRTEGVI